MFYYNTIKENEWGDVSKKMKDIIFHKYFLGKIKSGRGIEVKWNDENKDTKRLRKFVSKRGFDEYGDIISKVCSFCGRMLSIEKDGVINFRKNEKSRDGLNERGRCCIGKTKKR
tara:strand:+ start:1255 stop:1596 length:342 start_codon:yes stop_codon:yes gene_type:complete